MAREDQGGLVPTVRQAGRQAGTSSQMPSPQKSGSGGSLRIPIRQEPGGAPRGRWCQGRSPEEQGEGQREEVKPVCMSKEGPG